MFSQSMFVHEYLHAPKTNFHSDTYSSTQHFLYQSDKTLNALVNF